MLPPADIAGNGVSAFLDAVDTTFKVWGGAEPIMIKLAAIMFILAVVSSASAVFPALMPSASALIFRFSASPFAASR